MTPPPDSKNDDGRDPWFVSEGRIDGELAIFRGRQFLPNAQPSTHSVLFIADWDYEASAENGMPSEDDSARMEAFENALVSAFERENESICVLYAVFSCDGHRWWKFYCRSLDEAQDELNKALSGFENALPIDLRVEDDDPEWSDYTSLMREVEEPS